MARRKRKKPSRIEGQRRRIRGWDLQQLVKRPPKPNDAILNSPPGVWLSYFAQWTWAAAEELRERLESFGYEVRVAPDGDGFYEVEYRRPPLPGRIETEVG